MARHTGCDAHHVYTGTRNETHLSPSQGSQLRFTEMSSWCATLPRLTASVEISVFPAAAEEGYCCSLHRTWIFSLNSTVSSHVYGILNLKTTKIDLQAVFRPSERRQHESPTHDRVLPEGR